MNIYGVRGYPTPDFTDERHCRTFSIPNTTIALAVFMGALWELTKPEMWQEYGDMTPEEAADQMRDVIWEAYENDWGICPVLEAPYWDTYANVDDEEPEGAPETWYGELVPVASLIGDDELTWRENLGIWAIAGFIAYSGQIGGAIAFIPFARRFVLKFRGNPLGAIAEIFVDAVKLATVDTNDPEERIKAIDIQLPDDDEEHEIWVAVSEESAPGTTLQVVRKELNPNEVYPENLRYNEDCDCIQQTYDGGATWVRQDGQDPRHSTTFLYPPITADDPRCQAAANMTLFFQNLIGDVLGVISAGLDALGVATSIMPLFVELGPFAILIDLGIGLSSALIGLGVDVINAEFTPEFYEALTCVFFCNIQSDGTVNEGDLSEINADVIAQFNPDVQLIMGACFLLMGEVGLSNAGTIGDAPADCDECECNWCYTWDLTTSEFDFELVPDPINGGTVGSYSSGLGFITRLYPDGGNDVSLQVALTFPMSNIVEVQMTVAITDWYGDPAGMYLRQVGYDQPVYAVQAYINEAATHIYTFTVNLDVDGFTFQCYNFGTQDVILSRITLKGTGDNPFGSDNC